MLRSLENRSHYCRLWNTVVLSVAPAVLSFLFLRLQNRSSRSPHTNTHIHTHTHTPCPSKHAHTHTKPVSLKEEEWRGVASRVNAQEIQLSRQQDVSETQPPLSSICPPTVPHPFHPLASQPTPYSRSATPPKTTKTHSGPFAGPPFHTLLSQYLFCL